MRHILGKPTLFPAYGRYEFTKHPLPVLGSLQITTAIDESTSNFTTPRDVQLQFVVTKVPHLNLLGRDAIKQLHISVDALLHTASQQLKDMLCAETVGLGSFRPDRT